MRILSWDDLSAKGIKYSKQHLFRLIKDGKFPAPIRGLRLENCWSEEQIDQYIADRIAAARTDEAV